METDNGNTRFRFGDFEANLSTGELFRMDRRVRIERKPFQVLELLLHATGALVSRNEIYDCLWPDVNVNQQRCLNVAIGKLRAALAGQDTNSQLVETVGDRGYRLAVPVGRLVTGTAEVTTPQPIKLAVLPFQNFGGVEDEYLSYGLTEQLIAQMGRAHPNLSVIAPASSMHYQGAAKELPEIGRELDSGYLLCGSVFRADGRLRITAKLIRTADCVCLWAEAYSRDAADLFAVQDQISKQITKSILHTLPAPAVRGRNLTTAPVLYEQYLKAGYFFAKGHEEAFEKAVALYQGVIASDPDFAPAYASLAVILTCVGLYGGQPPKTIYDQVHTLAKRSLVLCPDLPDAYVALGYEALYRADFPASEAAFLRATQLNPSLALGHQGYSMLMTVLGRHDEAFTAMRRARDLDPLSPMVNALLGCALYFGGRLQEALSQAHITVELEQNFSTAHIVTGWILLSLGDRENAIRAHRAAVHYSPESVLAQLSLALTLAATGNHDEARSQLQAVLDARHISWAPPCWIAAVYTALSDPDRAFSWLEVAIDECDGWRVHLAVDPRFRPLAGDPRFRSVLQRLGLPGVESATPSTKAKGTLSNTAQCGMA